MRPVNAPHLSADIFENIPKNQLIKMQALSTIAKMSLFLAVSLAAACNKELANDEQPKKISPIAAPQIPLSESTKSAEPQKPQHIYVNPYAGLVGHSEPYPYDSELLRTNEDRYSHEQRIMLRNRAMMQRVSPNSEDFDPALEAWFVKENEIKLEGAQNFNAQILQEEMEKRARWNSASSDSDE